MYDRTDTPRRPVRPAHAPRWRIGRARTAAITTSIAALASQLVGGCGLLTQGSVVVNVGYQSKTIDTVNAGTVMRDRGDLEKALNALGRTNGKKYRVVWQDFSSGAPLTAQMIATHVDIGSMGDYPLLTNGSKTKKYRDAETELVATTGYSLRGSLNQVVVPSTSTAHALSDLIGKRVSTSLGSAGDGMLSTALRRNGIAAGAIKTVNQDPAIGASAIDGGQVDALAQFVPWPQLVIFRHQGRLLYDGGDNNVPTFHGVVVRKQFADAHPEIMAAFMQAMNAATNYINSHPLAAAQRVSQLTGLEPEVVYLYNGPNGLVSFDMTIKKQFALSVDRIKQFLVSRGSVAKDFTVASFINDAYLRQLFGDDYQRRRDDVANPIPLTGHDELCQLPVEDPAQASELWAQHSDTTTVSATPTCLLRRVAATAAVRAAYVPDTVSGTRLFADHAVWLDDPAASLTHRYKPFATTAEADAYRADHPSATPVTYAGAVAQSRPAN